MKFKQLLFTKFYLVSLLPLLVSCKEDKHLIQSFSGVIAELKRRENNYLSEFKSYTSTLSLMLAWNEHSILEDSINLAKQRKTFFDSKKSLDSVQKIYNDLYPQIDGLKSSEGQLLIFRRATDSIAFHTDELTILHEWESGLLSDLRFKGFDLRRRLDIIDSVASVDIYDGTAPDWYKEHQKSKRERYSSEFKIKLE